jgi:hypothetical protein
MDAGRIAVVAATSALRSGVRLRADRRTAPTGSRTLAVLAARGTRGRVRVWLRESPYGARPEPAGDTNLVPVCVTRMEPAPRCMCRWYPLLLIQQSSQRQRLFVADGAASDGQLELA